MQRKKDDPMAREKYMRPSAEVINPIMPSREVLEACRSGLTKRIKLTARHIEKQRLMDIRDEIDFLIDSLWKILKLIFVKPAAAVRS